MTTTKTSTSMWLATIEDHMPVFFDTHTALLNNKPPATLITGSPGSGKTFLTMLITTISAITGKVTLVLDPKGDFLGLYELRKQFPKFTVWNLSNKNRKGLLDPFYMFQKDEDTLSLVLGLLNIFLGGIPNEQLTAISPILEDVIKGNEGTPSLMLLKDRFRSSEKVEARNVGTKLELISKLSSASLCFAPGNAKRRTITMDEGLIIVSMPQLQLGYSAQKNSSSSADYKQNLASGIFYLITQYINSILYDDETDKPKTILIDEAWAVTQTEAGANCIESLAKLGRSKNAATVLVSQNLSDLQNTKEDGGHAIENTLSTYFTFNNSIQEAKALVPAMRLPENQGFDELIANLTPQYCIMRDWRYHFGVIHPDVRRQDWLQAFNTNPLEKHMRAQEQRATKNHDNSTKNK